jgi:hypothetical protein
MLLGEQDRFWEKIVDGILTLFISFCCLELLHRLPVEAYKMNIFFKTTKERIFSSSRLQCSSGIEHSFD